MPLGFYGVKASLPAIQSLQETYGLDLERLQPEDKGAIVLVIAEIIQQTNAQKIKMPKLIELSSNMEQLYRQGGREQVLALLKFVVERL